MKLESISFKEKLAKFTEHWSPKVIAEMNDYQFKLVKIQGHFTWHDHKDTDEVFLVLAGEMVIDFRDGSVPIAAGEMFVVPKGFEHKPFAEKECQILVIEPKGVSNTGDEENAFTAKGNVWI